ncbi:MAG: AraC family transcriptional regulator [Roseiflexaceae bacterium]|nr:AraC family transcriptional regulator [Roseiflexaceae bacterium]
MDGLPHRLQSAHYLPAPFAFGMFQQTLPEPIALHWHEFYELCYVLAGSGTHMLNGTTMQLQPGSMFLLTPADFHALLPAPPQPLQVFNIIFAETLLTEETRGLLFSRVTQQHVVSEAMRSSLEADFARLLREFADQQLGAQHVVQSTLIRILIDFVRATRVLPTPACSRAGVQHQALQRALVYIHHHFRQPLTLDAVARAAHLSPTYLSERFHERVGMTFQAYVQRLRIEFARSIVVLTTLPITEIAYAAGFVTLSHFERVFKQHYHMSPRQYRQLNGNITIMHMEQL